MFCKVDSIHCTVENPKSQLILSLLSDNGLLSACVLLNNKGYNAIIKVRDSQELIPIFKGTVA